MGKGDPKTKRGKIFQGSYGKTRPKKSAAAQTTPAAKSTGAAKASGAVRGSAGKARGSKK
jgi:30S ribosomal protein S31